MGYLVFLHPTIPEWLDLSMFLYQEVALIIAGICSRPKQKTAKTSLLTQSMTAVVDIFKKDVYVCFSFF